MDRDPSEFEWDKLQSERAKLKTAEAQTRAEILLAQSSISSLFAKMNRLERQREFLESRAGKFIESEVKTVEELERLEDEASKALSDQAELQSMLDSISLPESLLDLSESFVNSVLGEGVVGDTHPRSSGRSSNS